VNLVGKNDYDLYDKETAESFRDVDRKIWNGSEQVRSEETVVYPNGDQIITETLKTQYYGAEGQVAGLIGISRDITQRKREQARIEYLNAHDIMTGLYNRMYYDAELDRIDSAGQLPYSVIMVDIDSLKLTNDLFGHSAGDRLIIQTAKLLKECCPNGIVARLGGDEFSILLPGVGEEELKQIAICINAELEGQKGERADTAVLLSASYGYATKNSPEQTIAEITNYAEEHMYRRKLLKHQSIRSTLLSTIKELLFSKSNETMDHANRMASLAKELGRHLGLNEADMDALELMATLHDLGKIGINNNILSKPSELNDAEWAEIRKHPEIGYRIALTIPELQDIAGYILSHHERWDGKGYPEGLTGREIPYISRIISVVDAYDAMTEHRSYRKNRTQQEAAEEILRNAGTQFDPDIVNVFVHNVLGHAPGED
jgi:diguanylate cyclase (GGDEF)-like protein